jgi:MFS family permease
LILESVNPEQKGRAFGLHRAMDSFGAVLGPLWALLMISIFAGNYRKIFLLSFLPALLGVLVLIFFVKEKRKELPVNSMSKEPTLKFKWKELDPKLRFFLIISAVFALGNSSDAFLILRAQNIGLGAILTVAAYVVYNIFYTIFSYPAGVLSDKIGSKKVLVAGFFLFSLVYFGFGLAKQPWLIWILFSFYGLYIALTDGVSRAYISNLVPREKSGTAFGAYQMIIGFGVLIASILAGLLWNYLNPSVPFIFGAITALVAVLLFSFAKD